MYMCNKIWKEICMYIFMCKKIWKEMYAQYVHTPGTYVHTQCRKSMWKKLYIIRTLKINKINMYICVCSKMCVCAYVFFCCTFLKKNMYSHMFTCVFHAHMHRFFFYIIYTHKNIYIRERERERDRHTFIYIHTHISVRVY